MFGLTEERYQFLHEKGFSDNVISSYINRYGVEAVQNGYRICEHRENGHTFEVPGAVHVETIAALRTHYSDWDACRQAEKDGVPFINDMPGLEKGCYVDTVANRAYCSEMLQTYPDLRIEQWIRQADEDWSYRYAEFFPDILPVFERPDFDIIDELVINGAHHFMGIDMEDPTHYATWQETDSNKIDVIRSFTSEAEARRDLLSRALNALPGEEKSAVLLSNLTLADKEVIHKEQRAAIALSSIEFALSDAAEDLGFSKQERDDMLDNPGFKKDIIEAYYEIDHTFDEGLLFDKLQEVIQDYFPQKVVQVQQSLNEIISSQEVNSGLDAKISDAQTRSGKPELGRAEQQLEK